MFFHKTQKYDRKYSERECSSLRGPTRAMSYVYLIRVRTALLDDMSFVWIENRIGEMTHPCGAPAIWPRTVVSAVAVASLNAFGRRRERVPLKRSSQYISM